MTAKEILTALGENEQLVHEVFGALNAGMWDEWDCPLHRGFELFGSGPELRLAAAAGAVVAS